ncbi:TPA: phage tail protein [Salmonella enterica subsp. enterica serovar Infantis]|uniref:Minor tail protein n=1 Tax=Salmonella phage F61 TaxID=2982033 RepID=A0A977R8S9_9CAUD|nr:minor tail protein [Phage NBSal001]UXM05303.1 minor tail protein [Salmonella phage F115]UXM05403.1 minor tail protein [Salmonella phage F61]HBI4576253.1 phage tail protein [Salmonella enterica subsp. enterica serovar Infantis]
MLDEFTWCTQIQSGGGTMTTTNNDREVVFGNGYRQKASSGFNTERREFSIVYVGSDYKEVKTFMTDHRLKPFLWRMPDGNLGLFTVKAGSVGLTPISPTAQEVKATFTEEFTSMR